jgi:hypothetical protein
MKAMEMRKAGQGGKASKDGLVHVPPSTHEVKKYEKSDVALLLTWLSIRAWCIDFEKLSIAADFVGACGNLSTLPYFSHMATAYPGQSLTMIVGEEHIPHDEMFAARTARLHMRSYEEEANTANQPASMSLIAYAIAMFNVLVQSEIYVIIAHNRDTEIGCLLYLCELVCLHGTPVQAAAACLYMRKVEFACTMRRTRKILGKRCGVTLSTLVALLPLQKSAHPEPEKRGTEPNTTDPFSKAAFNAHHPAWDVLATIAVVLILPFIAAWAAAFSFATMDPKYLPGSLYCTSLGSRIAALEQLLKTMSTGGGGTIDEDEVTQLTYEMQRLQNKVEALATYILQQLVAAAARQSNTQYYYCNTTL